MLKRVFVLLAVVISTAGSALPVVDETFTFEAEVGKILAVDLKTHTSLEGEYRAIHGAAWLSVATNGIMFGTPAAEHEGPNKVYFSVTESGEEHAFLAVVNVKKVSGPAPALPKFSVKVGDVLHVNLAKELEIEGVFSYDNLPEWLEGLENGTLVGAPEAGDAGTTEVAVYVRSDEKESAFRILVEVKAKQDPSVATIAVGTYVTIDIWSMIKLNGTYEVQAPSFLTFTQSGYLVGTPRKADVGLHRIWITVTQGVHIRKFRFDLLVVEN